MKKHQNKHKTEQKALKLRNKIFEFLISLDDYKIYHDLKPLKESEIQDIRNNLIKHVIEFSKRFNLSLTKDMKRRYCKKCKSYLIEGKNSKTRIHKSRIIQTCKICNSQKRIPLILNKNNKNNKKSVLTDKIKKQ